MAEILQIDFFVNWSPKQESVLGFLQGLVPGCRVGVFIDEDSSQREKTMYLVKAVDIFTCMYTPDEGNGVPRRKLRMHGRRMKRRCYWTCPGTNCSHNPRQTHVSANSAVAGYLLILLWLVVV